jgi:hypothetical protein
MAISFLMTTFNTLFDIIIATRVNLLFGIHDYWLLGFTNLFEDFLGVRYCTIVQGVIAAKVAPKSIEASIMALIAGMSNCGFGVVAPFFGNLCSYGLGINVDNLDGFWKVLILKLVFSLLPLMTLSMIPNKEEALND